MNVTAGTATDRRNVVLVHGGFVDGSGWQGVYLSRPQAVADLVRQAAAGQR
jgi:hypothetical protein